MVYMGGISFEARRDAWPSIPSACPECAEWGVQEVKMGGFNDGGRALSYSCGTMLWSRNGGPWVVYTRSTGCKEYRAKFEAEEVTQPLVCPICGADEHASSDSVDSLFVCGTASWGDRYPETYQEGEICKAVTTERSNIADWLGTQAQHSEGLPKSLGQVFLELGLRVNAGQHNVSRKK